MSDWTSRLRQASFRGVPFAMLTSDQTSGRRVAVHEFPDRDTPYVEDLGGAAQRLTLRGFLIENSVIYGGGDVFAQRAALEAAATMSGPGLLVHPTRGPLTVACLALTVGDREEQGWFEVAFEFVETGLSGALAVAVDTAGLVLGAADDALGLLGGLFGSDADGYVGASGVAGPTSVVSALFGSQALSLGAGGVFGLGATANTAALASSVSAFRSASAGLGLLTGAGSSTASAATSMVRAISGGSDPGSSMDTLGDFAGLFG